MTRRYWTAAEIEGLRALLLDARKVLIVEHDKDCLLKDCYLCQHVMVAGRIDAALRREGK